MFSITSVTEQCYEDRDVTDYLARRKGSANFYYRETTPSDVRDILKRRQDRAPAEVWVSLKTPDIREAKKRLPLVRAEQHRKWEALRSTDGPIRGMPTLMDLAEAAADFVHERFIEVKRRQLQKKLQDGLDISGEVKRRRAKIVQVELLPTADDEADMERLASAVCRRQGWDLGPDEGSRGRLWHELLTLVTKAVQHARGAIVETLEGRSASTSRDDVLERLGAKSRKLAKSGETLIELFNLYEADARRGGKSADTLATERKILGHFARFVGPDRDVADIGRPNIREFRRALATVPHRRTTKPKLKGMGLAEAARTWQKLGGEGRSPRTVNREVSAVSSFFAWLKENAYVDDNVALGFRSAIDKERHKYPPYTKAQLVEVFASPLFHQCRAAKPHQVGDEEIRDWRYWLPLCALFTGARAGEIAQLLCSDIRQAQDVWVFDFNDDPDEDGASSQKSLKTKSSRRIVPIHPALVRLGFLAYVEGLRKKGVTRVYPEIEPGPRGTMSHHPSRFWQRYLLRIGVKTDGLALHSFRHTFADECRRAGVSKEVLQGLLGHSGGSQTDHYGQEPSGNLAQRREAIRSLSFYGLTEGLPEPPRLSDPTTNLAVEAA